MSTPAIRPVRLEDAQAIHEMRVREQVAEFITSYPSERAVDARKFLEHFGPESHVFVADADGRVVGMAGLHVRDGKMRHSAWLGIMVHDEFHDRGIGRELIVKLLDVADRWLGLTRVDLTVLTYNERAIALYEKLGFVKEGTQRKAAYYNGKLHDLFMMARVKE